MLNGLPRVEGWPSSSIPPLDLGTLQRALPSRNYFYGMEEVVPALKGAVQGGDLLAVLQ